MKNIIKLFFLVVVTACLDYYLFFKSTENHKPQLHCGVVVNKTLEENHNKYGTYVSTSYYVFVRFDSLGVRDVDTTRNTFYNSSIGQKICFNVDLEEFTTTENILQIIFVFTNIIGLIFMTYYGVVLLEYYF